MAWDWAAVEIYYNVLKMKHKSASHKVPKGSQVYIGEYLYLPPERCNPNAAACYAYGNSGGQALLLQLSFGKGNTDYREETETRFLDLIKRLFKSATSFSLPSDYPTYPFITETIIVGDFTFQIIEHTARIPNITNVFIAKTDELASGLNIMKQYQEQY